MSWEVTRENTIRCTGCGRIGKRQFRNDRNNSDIVFVRFRLAYRAHPRGPRHSEPNQGAMEVPICPKCGPDGPPIEVVLPSLADLARAEAEAAKARLAMQQQPSRADHAPDRRALVEFKEFDQRRRARKRRQRVAGR